MMMKEKQILIFKAPTETDTEDDKYKSVLENLGYIVKIIPVLEFDYINLNELKKCLENVDQFSGIIFTSQRAVHAADTCTDHEVLNSWHHLPVFVVGDTSARAVQCKLGLNCEGKESGSAENLCEVILQRKYSKPLLFPCGNMKRDVLVTRLTEGGVGVHCVVTYVTKPHSNLASCLKEELIVKNEIPEYIVFFSPSGVKFTLPYLLEMNVPVHNLKLIALGSATEAALHESQLPVWSTCKKPTPENLAETISNCS